MTIAAWSRGDAIFPVEAAAVWLFAPFSSILTYEFAKALTHHPRATTVALFGPAATRARTSAQLGASHGALGATPEEWAKFFGHSELADFFAGLTA